MTLLVASGVWQDAMTTLAMVLVATVIGMVLGVGFGVWMGRNRRADRVIRPLLDAAQVGDTGGATASGGTCGNVNIAVNPWVGYEANAAVVGYVLQNKLNCKVTEKDLKEEVSWQGFGTGDRGWPSSIPTSPTGTT